MTIVFVGDLNLDLRIAPHDAINLGSDVPGTISLHPGGSAANAAVWATRVGGPGTARFVGCLGDDYNGALLHEDLDRTGVTSTIVIRSGTRSRSVAVLLSSDGNRAIVSDRDAAIAVGVADYDPSWLDGADWLHLNGYLLINPYSHDLFHLLVLEAKRRDLPFSFDPSSSVLLNNSFQPAEVLEAVAGAEVVFPSRDEASYLTGLSSPEDAAESLAERFNVAVVTCDQEGSVVAHKATTTRVPALPVQNPDATGAGDAYVGGFLASYKPGDNPQLAAETATETAARCVAISGGR